jgi:predicted dehydrogenase
MEAMWSRFLPSQVELRRLLAAGVVGEVRQVSADFGFRGPDDPRSRLLDPALGGGALLDVGIYVASFASLVFGRQPEQIAAFAHLGATAVDEQTAMVLGYPGGALANLSCAVRTQTPHLAQVCGTDGRIELPGFWQGDRLTIHRPGAAPEERILPTLANGFVYELAECRRCIRQGLTESPRLPLNESVAIMETLDRIRAAIGLCYPG